jgi:hypothetical protein
LQFTSSKGVVGRGSGRAASLMVVGRRAGERLVRWADHNVSSGNDVPADCVIENGYSVVKAYDAG